MAGTIVLTVETGMTPLAAERVTIISWAAMAIGFVNPQQHATVKIETFPYTKYGTLNGTVTTVSNDAVSDEKKGLIYHARVLLDRTKINVDGKQVNLSPGMAVTVEVKTGQRRVIEYFLSPLMEYADESLRER